MSKRHCFYSNLKTFAPYWSVWNFYSFILFHLKIKETSKSGTLLNTSKEKKKLFKRGGLFWVQQAYYTTLLDIHWILW